MDTVQVFPGSFLFVVACSSVPSLLTALIVIVVQLFSDERKRRRLAKIEFLEAQITRLYEPILYFIHGNRVLLDLNAKIDKCYQEEFCEKDFDIRTRMSQELHDEAHMTLNIENKYADSVRINNVKIEDLIRQNYCYIDPDDGEAFLKFYEDFIRSNIENDGRNGLPFVIHERLGNISFLRPEFIEIIERKFREKKSELAKLRGGNQNKTWVSDISLFSQ